MSINLTSVTSGHKMLWPKYWNASLKVTGKYDSLGIISVMITRKSQYFSGVPNLNNQDRVYMQNIFQDHI